MMSTTKPYLIRAIYEWCVDQGYTPYLAAQVDQHTRVPAGYVRDGQIVLNVGPDAINQLVMDNEQVGFQARFNGVVHQIIVPVANVAAIYARENGQGMAFEIQTTEIAVDKPPPEDNPPPRGGGFLKVIK